MLLIMTFCFKSLTWRYIFQLTMCKHKGDSKSIDSDDRNFSSVKPQQFFLNPNILFPGNSKKDQTYISDILTLLECKLRIEIKNKGEKEDDPHLFLNGSNFIRSWIIIPMLLIKVIFFTSYSPGGISFSSRSRNMRVLVKVLILTTGIFFSLVLRNYYSLNAPNFRRL